MIAALHSVFGCFRRDSPRIRSGTREIPTNAGFFVRALIAHQESGRCRETKHRPSTSGIRQAHRSGHSPNIVELTRDERGQFHIGWRRGPEDAVVDNNWHAMITSHYNWTAATKILESSIASVETRKLYQRFLDALTWYGDGISEETYAGKLVKFVAALERITITSGEKAGHNKVARRAAILASDRTEEGWLKYFRATQAVHS